MPFYASSHPILRTTPRRPSVLFCFAEKETEAQSSKQPAKGHKAWSLIQTEITEQKSSTAQILTPALSANPRSTA